MSLKVIVKPCGAGKTLSAAEIASKANTPVLYVAPTISLLRQFASLLRGRRDVFYAIGRKPGFNCYSPEVQLFPALGEPPSAYCHQLCQYRNDCPYLEMRGAFENAVFQNGVYLTTYSFLLYSGLAARIGRGKFPGLVIYDEMPPYPIFFENQLAFQEARRGLARSVNLRRSPLFRQIARHAKKKRMRPPVGAGLIRLVLGEETLLLSATPSIPVIRAMFPEGTDIQLELSSDEYPMSLEQNVRVVYTILRHSDHWVPPPWGCGFKKNTAPGFPYFNASVGLNEWRGKKIEAFGSFNPPPYVMIVLAALLKADGIVYADVDVVSDEPFLHPLSGKKERVIKSAVLAFSRDGRVEPVPYELVSSSLVQLLGRTGMSPSVPNLYFGSIPLAAKNHQFYRRYARSIRIEDVDYDSAVLSLAMYLCATGKRGWIDYLWAFYPFIFRHNSVGNLKKLIRYYRDRISAMNDQLRSLQPHVREAPEASETFDWLEVESDAQDAQQDEIPF